MPTTVVHDSLATRCLQLPISNRSSRHRIAARSERANIKPAAVSLFFEAQLFGRKNILVGDVETCPVRTLIVNAQVGEVKDRHASRIEDETVGRDEIEVHPTIIRDDAFVLIMLTQADVNTAVPFVDVRIATDRYGDEGICPESKLADARPLQAL